MRAQGMNIPGLGLGPGSILYNHAVLGHETMMKLLVFVFSIKQAKCDTKVIQTNFLIQVLKQSTMITVYICAHPYRFIIAQAFSLDQTHSA